MRRVVALAMVVAVLALGWAGCGGSDSDQQQVAAVITGYYVARASGDGESACTYLTSEAQAAATHQINQVLRRTGHVPQASYSSCADALSSLGHSDADALRNVQVRDVTVSGESAQAMARTTSRQRQGRTSTASIVEFRLTKTSAGWKIDKYLAIAA
ncbi:MAG: hypothetical protein ACRDMH_01110 [Solirubrobacterales bacterium]